MTRRILITGGAGNIGASLARRLVQNPDNDVVIVDNLSTGTKTKLPDAGFRNYTFTRADVNSLSDMTAVVLSGRFDYIFHYAAVVGVRRTLENPKLVLNDIDGLRNVLDLAKNTGVKRVFFSSSSEVYGEPVEMPQRETSTPLNSRLPYAIVKNVGEAFCRCYQQEYGLEYTIFRFFNTYGPLQSEDFVISKFIAQALRNENLTVYGDGSQTRTFCFVQDNLDVTIRCMEQGHCINDTMNVGSDFEISMRELAELIIRLLGSRSRIVNLPPLKEGDMSRRRPDIQKMRKILKRDLTLLEDGIRITAGIAREKLFSDRRTRAACRV